MSYFQQSKTGYFLLAVFFVFIMAFSACAVRTPVPKTSVSDVSRNLKYKTITFKKFTAASGVEQPAGPLAECEASSITYLRGKNIFEKVEEDKGQYNNSTLIVEANLTFLRIVSRAARFWGSWLIGRSTMMMDVKLIDSSTGAVIAKQELVGAPNAYAAAWTVGNADQTLPTKMGWLIGDFILANACGKQ
jgi:hypothetical protein